MEKEFYTCEYCFKKYRPTKRGRQKFCSDSCRRCHHNAKNRKKTALPSKEINTAKGKTKVEAISLAGIGNAALGTLLVEILKHLKTAEKNKAATKSDIQRLEKMLGRFHKINNHPKREDGAQPYFDLFTNKIVYFGGSKFNSETDSLIA